MNPVACRIELHDNNFTIEAKNPERFTHYGFGSFLEKPEIGEISMNKAAYDYLAHAPERRGLMGIEIFSEPIIAYGYLGPKLIGVGKKDISVAEGAWKWLQPLAIVED